MDDALLVRGLERVSDLPGESECLRDRQRAVRNHRRERRPLDELHDHRVGVAGVFDTVHGRNPRMVQRREGARFALEASPAIGVLRDRVGQHLDGHVALQPRIAGTIHLAHTPCAERADDLVGANPRPGDQAHRATRSIIRVHGSSSVVTPDGSKRQVQFTA